MQVRLGVDGGRGDGGAPSFFAPNTFFSGANNKGNFVVWHAGTSAGIAPCYGFCTTFRAWDRRGGRLHEETAERRHARPNGWLSWDARYQKRNIWGNLVCRTVPSGVHDYTLTRTYDDKCDGSHPVTKACHVTALR